MSLMLAVIALFAMLMVEAAKAKQAGNIQSPDASPHYWTGRIEQDTTWRDTVYVSGDVTIASGAPLTLTPNTQVHFVPYSDDTQNGLDSTRTELIVEGRLHAQAKGIVFRSAAATSLGADWYGIVVERGGLADVSNATIRDGRRCLYAKMGGRVTMDHVAFANCGKQTAQSFFQRSAASDSLSEQMKARIKRYYTEDGSLRIPKKVAGGTIFCFSFTVLGLWGSGNALSDGSYSDSGLEGAALVLSSAAIGTSVGFPLGVSLVDPYDSFPKTLLAGVIPIGLWRMGNSVSVPGFWMASIVSVISSLTVSELSRKPPQAHRISVGLVPAPNRGLSAVATLRF
ncbi:MAG: hypothetical protein OXE49_09145 [Gemmatimonadetes bacterium]|nr:hypothetical protein [Gemmatimonadota bacterium]